MLHEELEMKELEETTLQPYAPDWEPGDRLFLMHLLPELTQTDFRAMATTSQRLVEGARRSKETQAVTAPLPAYIVEFQSVFAKEDFDILPEHRKWDHAIELIPRVEPKSSKVRALNAVTIKNRYPLPLISELVFQLRGAKYFTKLDVQWGFNNVRIKPGDEWKAAFHTNCSLFEPLVMFFEMTNSSTTFQTMMNDIFRTLIAKGIIVVYLDDILIFTETEEEHEQAVRRVLEILAEHKLFLHPEKYEFHWKWIEYLRLVISENKVEMDPIKVAGVHDWPTPENQTDVQAFIGFVNFYRCFI